jgi:IclR family acetate operon transcriptional repressor
MARGPQQDYLVQPIMKALKMLEAIGERGHDVTLTEIAESLRMPKTTAFRYLRTLAAAGFVRHDAVHDRYGVGSRVRMFAQADKSLHRLRQIAVPVMERLGRTFNETVNLAIASGFHVVYVEMIEANRPLRMQARIGERHPINATALGKAMLAFLPEDEKRVLTSEELRSMTGETLTSPELLRDQLDQIRTSGVAAEQDEAVIGEGSLASPVFDSYGEAVGAIGVVLPSGGPERPEVSDLVRDAARAVSRELGAATWPPRPPGP